MKSNALKLENSSRNVCMIWAQLLKSTLLKYFSTVQKLILDFTTSPKLYILRIFRALVPTDSNLLWFFRGSHFGLQSQKKKHLYIFFFAHTGKACKSQWMFWLIIILVFLNTCVLATEHYRQPAWLDDFQEYTNLFFVVLFTCEMFLKMYSLGFQVS